MTADLPSKVCATCGSALNSIIDEDGAGYIHPALADHSHEPVPIDPPAGWTGECDFCGAKRPTFVLPAASFELPRPGQYSEGNWAACDACASLLRTGSWSGLMGRTVRQFRRRWGFPMPAGMRFALHALHQRLRNNVTGPVRRLDDTPDSDDGDG
ncbi:MAG TPA: hypothetical protein VFW65_32015 [Pseudonocardiaceae bacterium]|nr:hypothetical protein [Pseudonocardiaceae bacterium]